MLNEPGGALYCQSPFAHGYRHGYEEGFHVADQDIHMVRGARQIDKLPEYKHPEMAYRHAYGDKNSFQLGFRQGLWAGYEDGINLREFRAVNLARTAAGGLNSAESLSSRPGFDTGFAAGYDAGLRQERGSSHPKADNDSTDLCAKSKPAQALGSSYCQGFTRGYQFGYGDSQVTGITAAKNRPPK